MHPLDFIFFFHFKEVRISEVDFVALQKPARGIDQEDKD